MYESGKMRAVEAILRVGRGGIKESEGGGEFNKIYCKHFCKCYNVSPVQQ
jgi:hypothetical protein